MNIKNYKYIKRGHILYMFQLEGTAELAGVKGRIEARKLHELLQKNGYKVEKEEYLQI